MNVQIFTKQFMGAALFFLLFAASCSTEPENEQEFVQKPPTAQRLPELKTLDMKDITTTSALATGQITDKGTSSVTEQGACLTTSGVPTRDDTTIKASKVSGSGEFEVQLSGLKTDVAYNLRTYAMNKQGIAYGNQVQFKTNKAEVPVLKTSSTTVAGAHTAYIDAELIHHGGAEVTEKGICWSERELPTPQDNKLDFSEEKTYFKARLKGLKPESTYYVRSYAINAEGIGYGEQVEVKTIAEGNITFTVHRESNPSPELQETYKRLQTAFENATYYYNEFTSIQKNINVYYNPGVPTADGNINGTIRVGPNASYQRTGTAMHEIMHTVGVGQHHKWNELIAGGTWNGSRANEILQMMTNSPSAIIKGDGLHFWPFGINGAHEDSGEEMLYITHALILQGMKIDGLPGER